MSDHMGPLGSAVYSLLNAGATVSIYDTLAPQGSVTPYAIFQDMSDTDEYAWDGRHVVSADFMLKVVSDRLWAGQATHIYPHLHNIMQGGTFSVSGWIMLRSTRTSTIRFRDPGGFWHIGGLYRVELYE